MAENNVQETKHFPTKITLKKATLIKKNHEII